MNNIPRASEPHLKRTLTLFDLVIYGMVLTQPTAPMPVFGVAGQEARGHVALTMLIGMVAMSCTAVAYGRMAAAYPVAGSAYSYVGREIHPFLGKLTGWSLALEYVMNPLVCVIWCSKASDNILPVVPYWAWVCVFVVVFTVVNLRGIETSARMNEALALGMGLVIVIFLIAAVRYLMTGPRIMNLAHLTQPFYDPATFRLSSVLTGTSVATLTYIGFDGISTLSEEAVNPRRNILWATVLTCLATGVLATVEVYVAQLVWPDYGSFTDMDTAYSFVAGRVGGPILFQLVNATLLVACMGSGLAAQLGGARLLYGMGRDNAIPSGVFGKIDARRQIPRDNILMLGAAALIGSFLLSYQMGAELLNFGAFIAFMGVNAAAFVRFYWRNHEKRLLDWLPPALGFFICLYIWWSLRLPIKLIGCGWLLAGAVYFWHRGRAVKTEVAADASE